MSDRWKDIFILITLGTVAVLAGCWFIDVLLIDGLKVDKGFLGSILGGIIGALGVIGTTFFIIEANKDSTKYAADLQDRQVRERDYVILLIKQIEEVNQILNQCTESVFKNVNLMVMVADGLRGLKEFEINNDLKNLDLQDQETRVILIDRYYMFEERYKNLRKEEGEERYKILVYLRNLQAKTNFIPQITQDIADIDKVMNFNAKKILDYFKEIKPEEASPESLFEEYKTGYLEKEKLLRIKLNNIVIDLLAEYKKAP
ncbi:hypothetical protein [Lysinibacillus agricola]|uniref:hypothetical protein n=1 Tax=Lysinibacillus agricola TaxID=2590012 RepID=UPI003C1603B9